MHSWNLSVKDAIQIQKELAPKLICKGKPDNIRLVAGADLSYKKEENLGFCVIVNFRFPELEVVEMVFLTMEVTFPYVPGLLSFREGPIVLKAFEKLQNRPNVILFDGQGVAHPRKFGIASHIGLLLNIPSIGCAKSRLYGEYKEPGIEKGSSEILVDRSGEQIGSVLRTRNNVKPIFVSPGHLVGFDESVEIVMQCVTKYRIPEPTRIADMEVERYKKEHN